MATLEARTLAPGQIKSLQGFAAKVAQGLAVAEALFDTWRRVIELLDARATLAVEGGQKVIYARCVLRPKDSVLHLSPRVV